MRGSAAACGSARMTRLSQSWEGRMRILTVGVALLSLAVGTASQAQSFSSEEQEVWDFIERCNELFNAQDAEGALRCFHEDFSGWGPTEPFPRGKKYEETIGAYLTAHQVSRATEARPFTVRVYGNFAFAHYLSTWLEELPDGTFVEHKTAWTDLLLRENGQWSWIGDHGHTVSPN